MDYRDENGKRIRVSTHTSSILEAKKCLKQAKQKESNANRRKLSRQKIGFDAVAEHFLHKYSVLKKSHKTDQEIFQRIRVYFVNIDMACIELEDFEQFVIARRSQGVTDATIQRELAFISVSIKKFNLKPEMRSRPLGNYVKLISLKNSQFRQRYLSLGEAKRLIEVLNKSRRKHILWFILIDLNSGFRKSEILGLRWTHVDLASQIITLDDTKAGIPHIMPMNDALTKIMTALLKETRELGKPENYVISKNDGSRYLDFKKGFKAACKEAGIENFVIHDLRHTFATWLVQNGEHLYDVKDLLNHSSVQTTERYAHHENLHKKHAVKSLDGHGFNDVKIFNF